MPKQKLTKRFVEAIRPGPADLFAWDSEVRGFGVRVKPSGRRSYIVQYRTAGNLSRRLTIGPHGVFAPETARARARDLLQAARHGADPAAERAEARKALTVADLAERFMTIHAVPKKKPGSVRTDASNLRNHVLPALGNRKIADVTRADITRLHHGMADTPGAANRTLALLSKMFNLAEKWGLRPDGTNPCRHVERNPERKMQRFLSAEEMGRLGAALAEAERTQTEAPSVVAAIRLLCLTGCRAGEILTLRWEHVDFAGRRLNLADSKTGPKTVHLNAPALAVLAGIERRPDNPFVLASRGQSHIQNLRRSWLALRKAGGLDGLRLHDLRHSYASVGAAGGLSLPMIGALLGHTQPATTARYAHLAADPLKQATDLIGQRIAAAMAGKSAEVVPLAPAAASA